MTDTFELTMRASRGTVSRPEWKYFKKLFRSADSSEQRNGFFGSREATPDTIDQLRALAESGCTFYGHHTAATEFNAGAFYATDDHFVAWVATDDGCPAVRVIVRGANRATMVSPEKALNFANQLARMTVLIDNGWTLKNPPKKPRLRVV